MARNIVTFDKFRPPHNNCRDDNRRDESEAVFLLAQTLTALNARFAFVESEQALLVNEINVKLDLILERLGIDPPPDPEPQPDPLTITGTPPTTGTAGQPYSFMPATAGGSGTRSYSLASGTLLAGLSLSTTTGAITGTPTAAGSMAGLSVRVTDDTGSAATTPTTVTITAAPAPSTQITAGGIPVTAGGIPVTAGVY